MAVYLVCEGPRGGLDDRVLDALVIQHHALPVRIETAGGSKGHDAVRFYLESRSPHPPDVAVAVEDRDYRPRTIATDTWANRARKSFIWRRHEIENYLLHPRAVLELFKDARAAGAAWANSLPTTEADTTLLLQSLANPLLEDHAAEVLKDELVQLLNGIGSLRFGPPTPKPPAGSHVPGQAEWLTALEQEAKRLCQTCNAVAALPNFQPGALTTRYHALLAQFQDPAYLPSGEFLLDMGGKELLKALSGRLRDLGAPSSLSVADELLRVLILIYQPGVIYQPQPDDFDELATILRQYR